MPCFALYLHLRSERPSYSDDADMIHKASILVLTLPSTHARPGRRRTSRQCGASTRPPASG